MVNVIKVEYGKLSAYTGIQINSSQLARAISAAEMCKLRSIKVIELDEDPLGLDVCVSFVQEKGADHKQFGEMLWRLQREIAVKDRKTNIAQA